MGDKCIHYIPHIMIKFSLLSLTILAAMLSSNIADDAPLLSKAMEVLSRATTTSQVLSFNLTGVIILIVLKIAVIAYTLLNTGNASETLFASRSLHDPAGYAPGDLTGAMCFLLYTNGDETKLSCIARATCESPDVSGDYLKAAKLWYKMHKMLDWSPTTRSTTASSTPWRRPMLWDPMEETVLSITG